MDYILMIALQQPCQQKVGLLLTGMHIVLVIECFTCHSLVDLNDLLAVPKDLPQTILHEPLSLADLVRNPIKTVLFSLNLLALQHFCEILAHNVHVQECVTAFAVVFRVFGLILADLCLLLLNVSAQKVPLRLFGLGVLLDRIFILLLLLEVLLLHQNRLERMGNQHLDCEGKNQI